MSLIDHFETYLGTMERGWELNDSSIVRAVSFRGQPVESAVTYLTLGLSEEILPMSEKRNVRQELVFSAYSTFDQDAIASFLMTFSNYILSQRRALLRGDVIGPSEPIIPSVKLNAVYASIPTLFDEEFATYAATTPATVLVWLIPIHEAEAQFVKTRGWDSFEDLLEAKDPDLLNLNRPSSL